MARHERMHLTLKLETTKPAARNFLQQQSKFDEFLKCYNNERPHQALNMCCPTERYVRSTRPYTGLPELDYPFHDKTVTVTTCGRICFNRQKINLSTVFAGQNVGSSRALISSEDQFSRLWAHPLLPGEARARPAASIRICLSGRLWIGTTISAASAV